jgi:hypothetical protein
MSDQMLRQTSPIVPEVGPDLPPAGCVIGGTTYASGAANPANTCQVCKPATSPSAWSNADEGTSCGSGQYCNSGACKAGCFIAGAYYANAAANPANACQTCQTAFATTAWTASANGATLWHRPGVQRRHLPERLLDRRSARRQRNHQCVERLPDLPADHQHLGMVQQHRRHELRHREDLRCGCLSGRLLPGRGRLCHGRAQSRQ